MPVTLDPPETHQRPTEDIPEPTKANPRPTLQTRLTFEREYIQGKGTIEAIAERLRVSSGTANDWYYQSGLKEKRLAYAERVRQTLCPPEPEPIRAVLEPVVNGNAKVQMVEEEIERLNEQLKSDLKPSERASLVSSLDKLLEYVLPKSSRTKPRSKPDRRSPSVTETPEQVQQPSHALPSNTSGVIRGDLTEPVKTIQPLPDLSSYSVEQLEAALKARKAVPQQDSPAATPQPVVCPVAEVKPSIAST